MNNFETAFKQVIGFESGYVNHPEDPGGETKWGISKRSYPHLDIFNLSMDEVKKIYYQDFWKRMRLDEVKNNSLAVEIFEQSVNMGQKQATLNVQKALNYLGCNLAEDGVMGASTSNAINSYAYADALLKCLNLVQGMKYIEIVKNNPSQKVFFRGWLTRIKSI